MCSVAQSCREASENCVVVKRTVMNVFMTVRLYFSLEGEHFHY